MRQTVRNIVLAAAIVAFPLLGKAVDLGGISAMPANPVASDQRTGAWFIYALASGGSKSDALLITNNTEQTKTLDLYPADSTPTTGNGFALKQKAEAMDEVGSWIKLEKNSVTLAPHERTAVGFALDVPAGQAPGLYAGAIMLSDNSAATVESGIGINTRMGVRVYVTVTAPAAGADKINPVIWYVVAAGLIIAIAEYLLLAKRFKRIKKRNA